MANDINKEDPHYKGDFGSIYEVNKKFPTGGVAGDFVVIEGWAHYWNADRATWCVNAERDSYWDELITNIIEKFKLVRGATYMGVASLDTVPAKAIGAKMYYFATVAGTYKNFGDLVVPQGINVLYSENGCSWVNTTLLEVAQELGVSTNKVVSQKALNDALNLKADQSSVNEALAKKADKETVNTELAKKFDKESVAQESGEAEDKVMSQKAVSDKLNDLSNFKGAQQSPIAKKSGYYIRNGNYLTNNSFEVAIYKIKKNTTYNLHIKLVGGNDVGYYCNEDGSNPHDILGTYEGNASQFAYFDGSIISDVDTYICLNSVIEDGYYCDVNSSITLKEKLDNIDSEISNFKGGDNDVRIYCIGDSLTQGQGGDNSYPPKLANLSGKTVINYGSGGDRTFEIGARIGCIPFECSPFTIPASGSVQIAISTTDSMSPKWMENFAPGRQNANSFLNPYVIEGIKGNISHSGDITASSSNHKYYFTRISDGTAKKVDFPTMVFPETPISNKHIKVIWSGTNDGYNMFNYEGGVEHVVKEIKLLVDTAEKYIVVGCHDCNSSFSYDQLLAFNTKLKDTFGNHYVDIYDFIIKYGLAYEGLTATQQDKTDIANNIVPTSLRSDAIHFNSYGYDIIANLIYDRLCALGYL